MNRVGGYIGFGIGTFLVLSLWRLDNREWWWFAYSVSMLGVFTAAAVSRVFEIRRRRPTGLKA